MYKEGRHIGVLKDPPPKIKLEELITGMGDSDEWRLGKVKRGFEASGF